MNVIVSSVLVLLQQLLPLASTASVVGQIISTLLQIVPILVKGYKEMIPVVQNIINALSDNPATTEEQLKSLRALSETVDKAFEEAAAKALAEDAGTLPL